MKPWSIFWRLYLICMALGLFLGIIVSAVYTDTLSTTVLRWKPTFLWWLLSIFFWVTSSFSNRFFEKLLFGEKFKLTQESWLKIGRYAALLFLVLGAVNQTLFEISNSSWNVFKFTAVPVGLISLSIFLSPQLKQSER